MPISVSIDSHICLLVNGQKRPNRVTNAALQHGEAADMGEQQDHDLPIVTQLLHGRNPTDKFPHYN